jgi:hypothetical protein
MADSGTENEDAEDEVRKMKLHKGESHLQFNYLFIYMILISGGFFHLGAHENCGAYSDVQLESLNGGKIHQWFHLKLNLFLIRASYLTCTFDFYCICISVDLALYSFMFLNDAQLWRIKGTRRLNE